MRMHLKYKGFGRFRDLGICDIGSLSIGPKRLFLEIAGGMTSVLKSCKKLVIETKPFKNCQIAHRDMNSKGFFIYYDFNGYHVPVCQEMIDKLKLGNYHKLYVKVVQK